MIRNGDTFNIMRLDGLDPMIAWAMGAATGHTGTRHDGMCNTCPKRVPGESFPIYIFFDLLHKPDNTV